MTPPHTIETLKGRPYLALTLSLAVFFLFIFALDNCASSFHPRPKGPNELPPLSSQRYKNTSRREPLILVYNRFFKNRDWYSSWSTVNESQGLRTLRHCPTKCRFTWNHSYLQSADFVLVSLANYKHYGGKAVDLKYAQGDQVRVAFLQEPPTYWKRGYAAVDGIFNWVATNRRDSDVALPTVTFFSISSSHTSAGTTGNSLEELRASLKKKKLATWLVSHCPTLSEREVLVKTLQRHIPVDIFGACSDRNCKPPKGVDCRAYLGQQYKFYLAFENSLCLDYVTEKFYYSYEHNMVPVVFGWADYSLHGPPGSYINALDFNSVKDLGEHLLFLDRNDDEYMKYFAWRGSYGVKLYNLNDMNCIICAAMSDYVNRRQVSTGVKYESQQQKRKSYESVRKWHLSLPAGQAWTVFHIGKNIIFNVTTSCVRPSEHVPFKKWILGK